MHLELCAYSKVEHSSMLLDKNPMAPVVTKVAHTISKSCTVSHVRCEVRVEITVAPQTDLLWYNWHLCHLQFLCDLPSLIISPPCYLLSTEWSYIYICSFRNIITGKWLHTRVAAAAATTTTKTTTLHHMSYTGTLKVKVKVKGKVFPVL